MTDRGDEQQQEQQQQQRPSQRCCLGALYLSAASRSPTCVGFQHTPAAPVKVELRDPASEGWTGYKFVCLGTSLYAKPSNGSDSPNVLPYCEGIEVVVAAQAQEQANAAASPAAATARPAADAAAGAGIAPDAAAQQQAPPPQQQRPAPQPARAPPQQQRKADQQPQQPLPRPSWQAIFNSVGGSGDDARRFAARFQVVATRNAAAMQRALDSAFAATVKPVLDRFSPRD